MRTLEKLIGFLSGFYAFAKKEKSGPKIVRIALDVIVNFFQIGVYEFKPRGSCKVSAWMAFGFPDFPCC